MIVEEDVKEAASSIYSVEIIDRAMINPQTKLGARSSKQTELPFLNTRYIETCLECVRVKRNIRLDSNHLKRY